MVERRQGPRYEVPALYLRCVGLMLRGVPHVFFPRRAAKKQVRIQSGLAVDQHSDSEYNTGIERVRVENIGRDLFDLQ